MSDDAQELASLGGAVRAIREEQHLSLEDLATAATVDPARLAALEEGWLDPDYELLLRIAEALNTRLSTIFYRAEKLSRDNDSDEPEPMRPVTIRWRTRRSSSPDARNLEARLTLTFAGRLVWRLASWLFPPSADNSRP